MISDRILTSIAALSAGFLFYFAWNGAVIAITPLNIIGSLIALIGVVIWVWALKTLGRYLTPGAVPKSPNLITTGPFSFVRHPIYFGATLFFIGGVLISNDLRAIPFLVAIILVEIEKARHEEKELERRFPEYEDYKRRVGFLMPKFKGGND